MIRILYALCFFLAACQMNHGLADAGEPDAGPFDLAGSAQVFPLAAGWMTSQGQPVFSFQGLQLRLEDPFVVARHPDASVIAEYALGADGRFAFTALDGPTAVGVGAVLSDPSAAPSAAVSESLLIEGKPRTFADATAWGLPAAFVQALEAALDDFDLASKGFLLGQVLDASGTPVSGVGVAGLELDNTRVLYLDRLLKPIPGATATDATGAFLVKGPVDLMNFSVGNRTEFGQHKALAVPGQGFLLVFRSP
jgi:hypothetical protein